MTKGGVSAKLLLSFLVSVSLSSCAPQSSLGGSSDRYDSRVMELPTSYLRENLEGEDGTGVIEPSSPQDGTNAVNSDKDMVKSRALEPLKWEEDASTPVFMLTDVLSDEAELTVAAEQMAIKDFIHYVFGDLLNVNYILDTELDAVGDANSVGVTLSLTEKIAPRELFRLVSEIMLKRGLHVKYASKTFFIHRDDQVGSKPQVAIGIGRTPDSVPETAQPIMQVVPLRFGVKVTLERTLRELTNASISPDFSQSTIFVEGRREDVLRALELIEMLDTPAMRGRYIAILDMNYLDPFVFSEQVLQLLSNEGIDAAVGVANGKNLVLVPLTQMGSLAVFATNEFLLDRVKYWSRILDVPGEGPNKQYFLYHPIYARAVDLNKSISELLDLRMKDEVTVTQSTGNAPSANRISGLNSEISIVVDERANALIFYTTGDRYSGLLPLLRRLDVMPKQVMLDITIAEVSLKDEFQYGVEWALNRKEVTLTTQGAFGASNIGGVGLLIDSNDGPVVANFLSTNQLVNIISNPTLMVRDGVNARFRVGSNISVVGETTSDPISGERQTTSATYRQTGVTVSVTPTVNASGIVVMEITQDISNTVPGSTGSGGNPDIFERSIDTEVLAKSGQTVMLGGLISQNQSSGGSGAPYLSRIPLLGTLFKTDLNSADRTELVMLITPRIIEDLSGWEPLMEDFRKSLSGIKQLGHQSEN